MGLLELVDHREKIGTGWEWGVRCSKEREKVPECKSSMCMVGEWWEENNYLPVDSLKKKKERKKGGGSERR